MSARLNTVTLHRLDGTEEDVSIDGSVWLYSGFVCYRPAGTKQVTYVPASQVDRIVGSDPEFHH